MTEWRAEFVPRDGQELFARTLGEHLAAFVRRRWPRDTAKHISREWDVDPTTAKNLTKGHAAERTITKALRAEGWPLIMALGEAMTGETYEQFLRGVADEHQRARDRAAARRDHIRALEETASRLVSLHSGPHP
jgi:hypothetical protein